VEKHRRNSQYFKGKKLQNEIFNQLNIKKSKIDKDNFEKKINKKRGKLGKKESNFGKKKKKGEIWKKKMKKKQKSKKKRKKKCTVDYYCCNPQCIRCG